MKEGEKEGGANRETAGGKGGGVQLIRVDERGVRFVAWLLLLIWR